MKKILLVLLMFSCFIPTSHALAINSESLVAQDIDSGRIFYSKNADDVRLIASTTKIMTAIIAIESNRLEEVVRVGEEVLKMYGSNIYIELNEHMLLYDLVCGLLMRSGNDAGVVIANFVGGTEDNFIKMMNQKAKQLGMNDTTFSNPTGLDDDTKNYSTANDLAKIYSYAYQNEIFKKIIGTKKYNVTTDYKSYTWTNKVKILNTYKYATGGKTGYTPLAGRVLVSSASNNNLNLVIASFNHGNYDYDLHERIYEDIFYNYQNKTILNKNNFTIKNSKYENIYIKENFIYPLKKGEEDSIVKKVNFYDNPKEDGGIGEIYVYLDDEIIFDTELYYKKAKTSILQKIKDFILEIIS